MGKFAFKIFSTLEFDFKLVFCYVYTEHRDARQVDFQVR